ncbi:uncharacterized protein LOC123291685 [Chrysoperla carnea]|uniref:uncharacterized protein LOC123291685 n=1 Tax=Chrysoperla carnea TaxID=189513 RepID=UPI001D0841C1|nr:uncharacterized protein LOC123291685 [Chrysoperla carnea]
MYAHCVPHRNSELCKVFSLQSNLAEVFSSQKSPISCLDGIRTISTILIVMLHVWRFIILRSSHLNEYTALEFWYSPLSNLLEHGRNAVDTFFFLSSFLVMYNFQNKTLKGQHFSLWKFYLNRYFRLFPVLLIVFLFYITLGKFCGKGPMHDNLDVEHWRKNAWTQIVGIANFYCLSPRVSGLVHLWYVHCDTQLYLLTPIAFLVYLKFSKKISLVFICIVLLVSIASVFTGGFMITGNYGIYAVKYWIQFYSVPYFRGNSWIMGLLCAYFFIPMKTSPLKLNKNNEHNSDHKA